MSQTRAADEKVTAISLPVELYDRAVSRAATLEMSLSGYIRFCISKELGDPDEKAKRYSQHRALTRSWEGGQKRKLSIRLGRDASSSEISSTIEASKKLAEKVVDPTTTRAPSPSTAVPSGHKREPSQAAVTESKRQQIPPKRAPNAPEKKS